MAFLLGLGLLLGATPVAPQTGRTVAPFRPPSAEVLRQLRAILQKSEPDAEGYYPPEIHGWVRRGKARVIDGDTIRIGAMRIGLAGIDAPALRQTCRTAAGAPASGPATSKYPGCGAANTGGRRKGTKAASFSLRRAERWPS